MDINPLIVLPIGSGARVVDARILIADASNIDQRQDIKEAK
jgi:hypothetical protein